MNNLQVPDPGLIVKLEQLWSESLVEDENWSLYGNVRIVCRDGVVQSPVLLLSSISASLWSLFHGLEDEDGHYVLLVPHVDKKILQSVMQRLLSSSKEVFDKDEMSVMELLGVDTKYFTPREEIKIENNVRITGVSDQQVLVQNINLENESPDSDDGVDILFSSSQSPKKTKRKMFCKFCSLDFQTKQYSDYQTHINSHKNIDGKFQCSIDNCGKEFQAWCHFSDHFYSHNNSTKPHLCSYCSYSSITRANVRKHEIAVHEDPDLRIYKCNVCEKNFKTTCNLREHKKTHKQLQYNCQKCDKTFRSAVGLRQHFRIHTGEMFSCNVCGELFQSVHSVKRHEKDVHGVFDKSGIIKCPKKGCGIVFDTQENYKLHIATAHQSNRAVLVCHLCTKICSSKSRLTEHFRKNHQLGSADIHLPVRGRSKSLLKTENIFLNTTT